MTQEQSELPLAVMSIYGDALKKRETLLKKINTLKAEMEKHDLMIKGMDEIVSLFKVDLEADVKSSAIEEPYIRIKSLTKPEEFAAKRPRKSEVWSQVMEWMGDREVEVVDVCLFCEEQNLGVSRKQVRNWLNNAKIGGKLERVGNATYRLPSKAGHEQPSTRELEMPTF